MKWFPLCNYTHYSLQKAFSKPKQLAKKCAKNSYPACGIADYQSISGAVSFYQACVANDVKPIIGCAFDGFTLFAKNKEGWLELIRIVSTVDDESSVNKALLVKLANNGNMICVAKDEALSPVSGKDFYVKTEAFSDTYYAEKEHSELHRVLLCSGMKTTLPQIKRSLNSRQQIDNQEFFECNDYYLKDRAETAAMLINDPQMEVFDEIFNKIENYNILNRPILPNFVTPDGLTQKEYLRLLIEDAWSKMEDSVNEQDLQVYRDRIEREFGVIEGADLFGYFLVVRDIIDHCHSQGWMVGPGRGCFLPDTRVKMANGIMKNISDVEIGDGVIDCYGHPQEVYDTLTYIVDESIVELEFENGKIVRCTQDHKFLTHNRGWVEAKNLSENDDIVEI